MKRVITLCSSLLIFAGLKAQTVQPPAVKKETVKPGNIQPGVIADSLKTVTHKDLGQKDYKLTQIKKAPVVQMKETATQMKDAPLAKPHKR